VTLVLATANVDKATEIRAIIATTLSSSTVQTIFDLRTLSDYPKVQLPDEGGISYRENAMRKAQAVSQQIGLSALGDDSGLEIDALKGAPGLYSARFAGEGGTYADCCKRVLEMLRDVPEEKRTAKFVCAIALTHPNGETHFAEGYCHGRIAGQSFGGGGFGYDPIFRVNGGQTLAELSRAEKNQISHRGHAVRAMLKRLFAYPPSSLAPE